jgi:hypothetical protein
VRTIPAGLLALGMFFAGLLVSGCGPPSVTAPTNQPEGPYLGVADASIKRLGEIKKEIDAFCPPQDPKPDDIPKCNEAVTSGSEAAKSVLANLAATPAPPRLREFDFHFRAGVQIFGRGCQELVDLSHTSRGLTDAQFSAQLQIAFNDIYEGNREIGMSQDYLPAQ